MKKIIAISLAVLMAFCCAAPAFAEESTGFTPVIRFAAASDTHVKDADNVNSSRIPAMMELAYSIADSDSAYGKVDALLIAGDLTNDGTTTEFDKFWSAVDSSLRDETQFIGVVAKNHDGYKMSRKDVHAYYTDLSGNSPDFHVVINGYHFIGLSASDNDTVHYDNGQIKWLDEQLAKATAEDPDKPVFVTHHEHVRGTVYGSSNYDGWGVPYFKSTLDKYPQVVDFSGHSHFPLNDPRSVWQGNFTAIGTGAIYYSEFTIDETRSYDPPDCTDTVTCWIVELDKNNDMRLRGYDITEKTLLCEYTLKNPADKNNREFTPAKLEAASKAPEFESGAAIQVTVDGSNCKVTAPLAKSVDGKPVVLYRVFAKNSLGITLARNWTLPPYYRAIPQQNVELTLDGLASGDYTISVVAENAYGMQSEPLEAKVSVEGGNVLAGLWNAVRLFFIDIFIFFIKAF